MNRRRLLGSLAAVLAGAAVGLKARLSRAAARIRPPGARPEADFQASCIRCFRCAEVCPPRAIRFESSGDPSRSDLPYLDLRERSCILCMKCTDACPTGALAPIAIGAVHARVRMGRPVLDRSRCLAWNGSGVCRLCYLVCPYPDSAVALVGQMRAPVFDGSACVGCGKCEEACPERARAIRIVPLEADA